VQLAQIALVSFLILRAMACWWRARVGRASRTCSRSGSSTWTPSCPAGPARSWSRWSPTGWVPPTRQPFEPVEFDNLTVTPYVRHRPAGANHPDRTVYYRAAGWWLSVWPAEVRGREAACGHSCSHHGRPESAPRRLCGSGGWRPDLHKPHRRTAAA